MGCIPLDSLSGVDSVTVVAGFLLDLPEHRGDGGMKPIPNNTTMKECVGEVA